MRYMPSRNPAQSGGGQPDSYAQHDPNAPTYGNIPGGRQRYYGDPNERSIHTPGSSRGQQGAFRPPTQPTEYVDHATPFFDQQHAGDVQRRADLLGGNDAYQQAKAAGDLKGQIAAMTAMRGQMQQDRFVAQGGTPETWQSRNSPDANWPVPRSPSGNYQYGPGRPGPTPPNVAQSAPPPGATQGGGVRRGATPQNAPMSGGMPPSQNPMMQGYQGGGGGNTIADMQARGLYIGGPPGGGMAGQVSGGQGGQFGQLQNALWGQGAQSGAGSLGNWLQMQQGGGYNPGQSKSGMGQSPYGGGPQMSTGGDMGMDAYNPYAQQQFNPYGNQGSIDPGFNVGPQQGSNMMGYGQNPYMPQGGGMQGGYMPFNGGNFSMPYDQYSGMGYW